MLPGNVMCCLRKSLNVFKKEKSFEFYVKSVDLRIKNKRTGLHQAGFASSIVPGTDLYSTL